MINLLESSIIAYFDNRLSDAERVDLLRQVNESDEARKLFRQHEVLRSLVQRAQAMTFVDADTETQLLSKIAPVARPWIFQAIPGARTFAGALAASALIFLGIYLIKPAFNGKDNSAIQQTGLRTNESLSLGTKKTYETDNRVSSHQLEISVIPRKHGIVSDVTPTTYTASPSSNLEAARFIACQIPEQHIDGVSDNLNSNNDFHSLSSIAEEKSQRTNNIRLTLQADSPPVNDRHILGVSGATGSVGYFITPSDIVSARFGYYSSRLLPPSGESSDPITSDKHDDHFVNLLSAGLAIEHQVLALGGHLIISGSIGAGLQSYGNYVSADISAVYPIFGNLQSGVGVSISHEHFSTSTWPVTDAESPTGVSQWANLEGKNFATAKIYYMVSYGF